MTEAIAPDSQIIKSFLTIDNPVGDITPREQKLLDTYTEVKRDYAFLYEEADVANTYKSSKKYLDASTKNDAQLTQLPISYERQENIYSIWDVHFIQVFNDDVVTAQEIGETQLLLTKQATEIATLRQTMRQSLSNVSDILFNADFVDFAGQNFSLLDMSPFNKIMVSYFFKGCAPCVAEIKEAVDKANDDPSFQAVFINTFPKNLPADILDYFATVGIDVNHLPKNIRFATDPQETYQQIVGPDSGVAPLTFLFDPSDQSLLTTRTGYDPTSVSDIISHWQLF